MTKMVRKSKQGMAEEFEVLQYDSERLHGRIQELENHVASIYYLTDEMERYLYD